MDKLIKEIDANQDDDINLQEFKDALLKQKNLMDDKNEKE